ncbi:hypothetical protein [Chryseobacterium sp. MFBS3-17]|uniref:hypothetical protein n=1 Tax=Chryseobacterium sp. MFBS3-17 TaxID=2886689 RepID=UPI001D0E69D7|nr:hypothetical protein [Chryseobacterium sp. MFBS3-17]MCC2590369.1 hypothetical protein [Chryseobacterium sp. MFBS3-17]
MNIFNFDVRKYALQLLPPWLRSGMAMAVVLAFATPLLDVYIAFTRNRKVNLIKLQFNYQKFSVQKRLNDAFDPIERRIRIVNAVQYDGVYLYTEAEDDPFYSKTVWLHPDNPVYLRTEAELYSEFDFIIEIPDININQIQLKAETDFYILPSKRYQIVII